MYGGKDILSAGQWNLYLPARYYSEGVAVFLFLFYKEQGGALGELSDGISTVLWKWGCQRILQRPCVCLRIADRNDGEPKITN